MFAGDTLYCSAKSGFIPGPNGGVYASTTAHQLRQTMRNLLDNLEEADMNFDEVVSTTVYLDDLSDTPAFDKVYAEYFKSMMPARTTIEQIAPDRPVRSTKRTTTRTWNKYRLSPSPVPLTEAPDQRCPSRFYDWRSAVCHTHERNPAPIAPSSYRISKEIDFPVPLKSRMCKMFACSRKSSDDAGLESGWNSGNEAQ